MPVKAECKGSLPGLVHDISASGATLFVEPMGVVQANNELKELQAREEKEIDRILRILSGECAAQRENILYDYDLLVQLDAIFARAQLSYAMDAGRPQVRKKGGIDLRRARHPLLDPAKAAPILRANGLTAHSDSCVVTLPPLQDALLADLVQKLAACGAGVVELTPRTKTLEEIFRSLTSEEAD